MISEIEKNGMKFKILTHHGFPFRRFDSCPENNKQVFEFFDNVIDKYNLDIITGDFNTENFMELLNGFSLKYKRTINDITTVDNKKFDDICVLKNIIYESKTVKLLSDHFIVITVLK